MIKYQCNKCGNSLETPDSMSGQTEVCPICKKSNPVPASKHDREEQLRLQRENEKQFHKKQEQHAQLQLQEDQQQAKLQRQTEILQAQQKQIQKHKADIAYQMSLSWDITRKATGTETGMLIFGWLSIVCGVLFCVLFVLIIILGTSATSPTLTAIDVMQIIPFLLIPLTCVFAGLLCFAIRHALVYLRTMPTRIIALQVQNPVS